MDSKLKIVEIFTVGFALASLLGYLTQRIRLPTILGYLLAGYMIGPFFPGFTADLVLAEELAEIGVVLMLFSVGLHFHIEDLYNVKNIAIPGAVLQTAAATLVGTYLSYLMGWSLFSGMIFGLALGVASTIVLVWVLSSRRLLDSPQGHISIGWLVVEDLMTVAILIMLPMLAVFVESGNVSMLQLTGSIAWMLGKFLILCLLMFTLGNKLVAYILTNIARLRSHEIFTLTLLALIFLIAFGSSVIFGTSIALGSFIAGMVIGKTEVRHQAAANSLPLKDIFGIVFFLSVGMLFNPMAIVQNFGLFLGAIGIVLLIKPLVAFFIVKGFGYSMKMALTVSFALAQIGEFSFILAEEAMNLKLLPDEGFDILVACALISIAINPLLFHLIDWILEIANKMRKHPEIPSEEHDLRGLKKNIVIVGMGSVCKYLITNLYQWKYTPLIIESNMDIYSKRDPKDRVIFGDATQGKILEAAHVETASLLIITLADMPKVVAIIHAARHMNPSIRILAYLQKNEDAHWIDKERIDYFSAEKATSAAFLKTISHLIHQYKI